VITLPLSTRQQVPQEDVALPVEVESLLRLLEDGGEWGKTLPLKRHREAIGYLQKLTGQYQEDRLVTGRLLEQWPAHPNLSAARERWLTPDLPFREAIRRLALGEAELRHVLEERRQLLDLLCERLCQRAHRHADRLAQMEANAKQLQGEFDQIACLPWLEAPWPTPSLGPASEEPLEQASQWIDAARQQAGRVLEVARQLGEVLAHLGAPVTPFVAPDGLDLEDLAARLEGRLDEARRAWQEIGEREKEVAGFFDRFTAVPGVESGQRLLKETPPKRWADIGHFLIGRSPRTEAGKAYQHLGGRFDLAGLLAAYLWQLDAPLALSLVAETLAGLQPVPSRAQRGDLLGLLDIAQLQELAQVRPEVAPHVIELIFAAALRAPEATALEYLEPLLELPEVPAGCAELCRACLEDWRAGTLVSPTRLLDEVAAGSAAGAAEIARQRQHLLDVIRQKPTMTYKYYSLWQAARTHFLKPLEDVIRADDPDRALAQWQRMGTLDEMVEECVAQIDRRHDLDRSHYQHTRRYLEAFEAEFRRWCGLRRPPEAGRSGAVRQALDTLRREAAARRSPACVSLFETLRLLRYQPDDPALPPPDLGQRVVLSEEGELQLLNPQLDCLMTWSWPLALKHGTAPVRLVLSDQLRQALGTAPMALADAVEEYWSSGEFVIAREAAQGDAALRQAVAERLEKKKDDLGAAQATLLKEAEGYRAHNRDIDACLQGLQRSLDDLQFVEATSWLEELDALVHQLKVLRDPVRLALMEYLREAGREPDEGVLREDLERQVELLRKQQELRRLHVLELERVAANADLPTSLQEQWAALARRIDRPASWPDDETAIDLEHAIQVFGEFLAGQLCGRDSDPETADLFIERLGTWVPEQFSADPAFGSPAGIEALKRIRQLRDDIVKHRPERRLLQQLGAPPPVPARPPLAPTTGPGTPTETPSDPAMPLPGGPTGTAARSREGQVDAHEILRETRRFVGEHMGREAYVANPDPARLRSAIRAPRWQDAREQAAALALRSPATDKEDVLQDVEAVYALALAHSLPTTEPLPKLVALRHACLATLSTERGQYQYYLTVTHQKDYEPAAHGLVLASGLEPAFGAALGDQLGEALVRLVDIDPSGPAYEWLRDLFWKASRLGNQTSARLADQLWEALRGRDNEKPRTCLLRLLFRMRRRDALKHLARHAEQVETLVRYCLRAFEEAEEDSSIRPQAREFLMTLDEQGSGKKNSRPWINLFQHLEALRSEIGEFSVQWALQSEALTRESEDGPAVVQLLLTPSVADPPRILHLNLLAESATGSKPPAPIPLVTEDEIFLRPKLVEVSLPATSLVVAGEIIDVGFRLTGESILSKPIDLSGHWHFSNSYRHLTSLSASEIESAWPGARGEPVEERAFHGREEEKRHIDKCIAPVESGICLWES
jgi:hypothetical protein